MLYFRPLFPFLGCSSKDRNPETITSDQAFQVRDMGLSGDRVVWSPLSQTALT